MGPPFAQLTAIIPPSHASLRNPTCLWHKVNPSLVPWVCLFLATGRKKFLTTESRQAHDPTADISMVELAPCKTTRPQLRGLQPCCHLQRRHSASFVTRPWAVCAVTAVCVVAMLCSDEMPFDPRTESHGVLLGDLGWDEMGIELKCSFLSPHRGAMDPT